MKKVRAAAVIAVATTAVSKAKDYARENPDKAADVIDKIESFVRDKAGPRHADRIDSGSAALRRGLGLRSGPTAGAEAAQRPAVDGQGFDPSI